MFPEPPIGVSSLRYFLVFCRPRQKLSWNLLSGLIPATGSRQFSFVASRENEVQANRAMLVGPYGD
jgi:hypothetical protein